MRRMAFLGAAHPVPCVTLTLLYGTVLHNTALVWWLVVVVVVSIVGGGGGGWFQPI